jgi:Holliday junction resolvase RusA-like endonuclease
VNWKVLEINPVPWSVGPVGTARKGGKMYAYVGRNSELYAYQQAVREILSEVEQFKGEVELSLFFWRQMEPYRSIQARTVRKHQADVTNLQKALEDALQGVLIENDKNVRAVHSYIVAQDHDTSPLVVVCVAPWVGFDPGLLPEPVWSEVDRHNPLRTAQLELEI